MNKEWWAKEVVYQIYPRSFKDSNHDGIGDLKGIIEKLDYFTDLGITMIWICPIFKSPMADNGYDIADFQDINPEFGTLQDLDQLIIEAKKRQIKVILDLVINHTSDEHPWFKEAVKNPDSKYRSYYIFKDAVNGREPNNWRSLFGGSSWEKVPGEDKYYLHVFHKKQPDLNWENPDMRRDIYKMVNWWLERGIAGFRLDSITFLKKDQDFKSLPPDGSDGLVSCKAKTRNRPGLNQFLNELKMETFSKHNCVTVGEAPGVPYNQFSDFIGEDGYFSMIFDFHYADIDVESGSEWWRRTNWTVKAFKNLLFESQETIQRVGWGANFIENHDQPRVVSKLIRDKAYQNEIGAKAVGAMYFFLRGTPFIYQGQEIGMTNFHRDSIEDFNDISSIDNYYRAIDEGYTAEQAIRFVNLRSRDNTRTPYQWNAAKNAGFSDVAPWIKMTDNYDLINQESQASDENSVYSFYQKMIELRNQSEYSKTLIYGDIEEIKDVPDEIIAYVRQGSSFIYSFTNLSNEKLTFQLPKVKKILLSNYSDLLYADQQVTLLPYQTILFE